jgi:intracellular sulfur oxidation DsrE/DsrF family protein
MTHRRDFLAQLAMGAAATFAMDADELRAEAAPTTQGPWDTSWIDRVESARYRVVFNATDINEGAVFNHVSTFLDQFHEVHNSTDAQTRPVVVARRLGVTLGLDDAMWDKFALGDDPKVIDPATNQPARRNIFWTASTPSENSATRIDTLQRRGLICLVCNVALGGLGYQLATQTKRDVKEVQAELRANLVPGAILVPSGIYALIRAQNAGCAYMPGA